ncbi:dihydropteroate synthase [Yoonia sediminilitoris]|uniref:Dihydropteroate synthase n=1 Tax=Yoonia sediminilitoris TaxID=1286148 RepID=A0A2T6KEL6_9RHOB|nr:dihydropteroate synthase [Yoonia sediminilitoris]PUB13558.1 dihydropteroate synthase [Yoonia sediminilitoris]RCW94728.1 dihydropteroate synthase [Yoonia sediminilitoris]
MTKYYQPIVKCGGPVSTRGLPLGDGPWWFERALVHSRDGVAECAPSQIPDTIVARLTAPRAPLGGLAMNLPRIMGILNVTPDSFSDGGQFNDAGAAVSRALAMVEQGADIIDIGGESTRPGAAEVPVADEIARTQPIIAAISKQSDVLISIDTRKAAVATAACDAGAQMINDVAAMSFDPMIAEVAAQFDAPICLMHAQGDPATMQDDPRYDNVLLDVYDYLAERIAAAEDAGIARDRIIVDPGIGFGKTIAHNLQLLRGLSLFHALGCPILLGASRKRFIGSIGGGRCATDRVAGSVAVALHGLRQGVHITRVHDTFETRQAFDLELAIHGVEQP